MRKKKISGGEAKGRNNLSPFSIPGNVMISDFNLVATTSRGNERPMCNELFYLLKEELGDPEPQTSKTKIRGLIVGKTTLDPFDRDRKVTRHPQGAPIRVPLRPRIVPIERVVPTIWKKLNV